MTDSRKNRFLEALASPAVVRVSLALLAVVVVYWSSFQAMAGIWLRSDTFAHGLIVAPFALYLVYGHRREALAATPARTYWPGLLLVGSLSLLWLVARYLSVNVVEQFAAVASISAAVLALAGVRVLRVIAFPLAFLLFAVPFGEFLIPLLMEVTADMTTLLLQLTGFPVYRTGLFIAVPGGDFEIAKACSGIRYLIASIVLGTIFAYLTFTTWRKRLIFIGFSVLVPIIANGIRAYLIVVLASTSGMKLAVGIDHFIYGWVFFGLVMFVLFAVGVRYRDDLDKTTGESSRLAVASAGPGRLPFVLAGLAVALLIGPLTLAGLTGKAGSSHTVALAPPPPGWTSELQEVAWQPAFQPADQVLRKTMTDGAAIVHVFVDVYSTADGGVDAASSANRLVDNKTWRLGERPAWSDPSMRIVRVQSGNRVYLVASWYQVGDRVTASPYRAKVFEALDTVFRGGTSSAIVTVAAAESDEAGLRNFIEAWRQQATACIASPGTCFE